MKTPRPTVELIAYTVNTCEGSPQIKRWIGARPPGRTLAHWLEAWALGTEENIKWAQCLRVALAEGRLFRYGQAVRLDDPLGDEERLDITPPVLIEPKAVRRIRAQRLAQKKMPKQTMKKGRGNP